MSMNIKNRIVKESIAEFIGTALLVFFGVGSVAALKLAGATFSQWEISIIWGLGVAIAIYCTAGISGAHLNPAVTIALATFNHFEKKKILPYILAQLGGAFFAAAVIYGIHGSLLNNYEITHHIMRSDLSGLDTASIFSTYAQPLLSVQCAFIIELVITAILMFSILAITDDSNGVVNGAMSPLLIGLVVAIIGGSVGPLTGFAMNPARDFGPKLFTFFAGWDWVTFTGGRDIPYFLVPLIAPIIGALCGAWLYSRIATSYLSEIKVA
ncbi:MIP/aquaporin family protein [Photobacterium phosphoreum]|uniref:MIP/aquaporin family protein n=1 Tax=Photobacterium phosphoreum TaxID=659 RepID=UPI0024B834F6|nr:MIP/aquaporin family protein [Photobacterium phosphoreum]